MGKFTTPIGDIKRIQHWQEKLEEGDMVIFFVLVFVAVCNLCNQIVRSDPSTRLSCFNSVWTIDEQPGWSMDDHHV